MNLKALGGVCGRFWREDRERECGVITKTSKEKQFKEVRALSFTYTHSCKHQVGSVTRGLAVLSIALSIKTPNTLQSPGSQQPQLHHHSGRRHWKV